ncbi:MAG: hypothetical protein ACHBN1_04065 [Heteroscytonema crispum UTEX LB 1556]
MRGEPALLGEFPDPGDFCSLFPDSSDVALSRSCYPTIVAC